MNTAHNLQSLGFDQWFEQQAQSLGVAHHQLARVVAVDKEQYSLLNASGAIRAKLSGKFRHQCRSPDDLPCVGDWLYVEKGPVDEFGVVHAVLPRKTFLRRKAIGLSSEYQMISANIDVVFVVQSCHFDFNLKRLERYLVMAAEGGASPIILLTKTDLVSASELADNIEQIRAAGITVDIAPLSNVTHQGVNALYQRLLMGKTYCFVGSSGVGKSTLINGLLGEERLATEHVSDTGEGTHTTVRRELMGLSNGALVIDNPGMREFGVLASEQDIGSSFADIDRLEKQCRFRNCSHNNEPGCAVQKALEDGSLSYEHFDNFVKLGKEAHFNQLSYAQKRKKDRDFGKFIKQAKQRHRDEQ